MAGIRAVFEHGPLTFSATTAANGGLIRGGQLVHPDGTTGRIRVATVAAGNTVLGVALGDAAPSDSTNPEGVDSWGNPVVNMHLHPNEVAVAYQGVFRLLNSHATLAVPFGSLVVAAGTAGTAGGVALREAQTFDFVIGRCVEPGGIAVGQRGKILLGGVGA